MREFVVLAAFLVVAGTGGCAGRPPQPVSLIQPQDKLMDCEAVFAEVQANNTKIQQLASDRGLKVAQNVVAGTAGLVFPVLWLAMDWQGTEDKEVAALQARQQYLVTMAEQRQCSAPEPAPTAARPAKR